MPFTEQDHEYFAGRDNEVKQAISLLYGTTLSILYGESGVGKTSLIRAGLLPTLRRGEHRVATVLFREWQTREFETRLRDEIFSSVLTAINRLTPQQISRQQLMEAFCQTLGLGSEQDVYGLPFDRFIKECSAAFHGRTFFIFDQFEEYIYYHPLNADGATFDAAFARAVNDRDVSASFLLSLREDGLGKLDRLRRRIPGLLGSVLRLDHLSREGARQAIENPLKAFNEHSKRHVGVEPALTVALLDQVDVSRLEMDKKDDLDGPAAASDEGPRYKALALEVVLTRLWEQKVGPILKTDDVGAEVTLTLQDLSEIAKPKKENETDVKAIVRKYFDDRLALITKAEAWQVAELLRGFIRSGGHKRARTVYALQEETGYPIFLIESLLEELASEPINIVRKVSDQDHGQYELHHDVMAFAIMDWSNRVRQRVYEQRQKRQQWLGWGTAFTVALIVSVITYFVVRDKSTTKLMQDKDLLRTQQRLVEASLGCLQSADPNLFKPDLGLLTAIDATAGYRRLSMKRDYHDEFVSPRALLALAMANAAQGFSNPQEIRKQDVNAHVPSVESADRQRQLVVLTPKSVRVKVSDDVWQDLSTEEPITQLGFSLNTTEFGVALKSGKVVTWTARNLKQTDTNQGSLAEILEISDKCSSEDSICPWFRQGPIAGWEVGYSDAINSSLIDAIKAIPRRYSEDEKYENGVPEDSITEEISKACSVQIENADKALRQIREALRRIGLDKGEEAVLAAHWLRKATQLSHSEVREAYFAQIAKLDPRLANDIKTFRESENEAIKRNEAINEIEKGNELAAQNDLNGAAEAYKRAISLDRELESKLNPEKTAQRIAAQAQAKSNIDNGNRLAKEGKTDAAISAYREAIKLDPSLVGKIDPEREAMRFAPASPTPVGTRP